MAKHEVTNDEIMTALTQFADGVNERFDAVDKRFDGVDKRFDGINKRFDRIENKLEEHDARFDKLNKTACSAGFFSSQTKLAYS